MHIGLLRTAAAAALLICFACGTFAAAAGTYRSVPAPGLDQRHASVGQPPARAAGLERTALRSIGVVFILWPPRTAAGRKTAPHHRHHQTSPRRYERHDAPGCAALCARRGREIGGRIRFLLASEHDFSSGSFGFGRHSGLRFRHHKEVKPKPNDGDPGKRKERRAVPCLDNHDSGERGG